MFSWDRKVISVLSCGFLLCPGLSNATQAEDMKTGQSEQNDGQAAQQDMPVQKPGIHIIQGDVLRMEEGNYYVQQKDGQEVRLQIDHLTQMMEPIKIGDRIVGNVDDHNYARWISPVP